MTDSIARWEQRCAASATRSTARRDARQRAYDREQAVMLLVLAVALLIIAVLT